MRIATSTIYENQTAAIDNLVAEQAKYGQELSTGKSLNIPQDNPTQIAQDLAVRTDNAVQSQLSTNLTNAQNQLTSVDGALGSLTSVIQGARQLAIEGAADTNTPSQLKEIAIQVGQLLQEAIGLSNTQYAGNYVFGGTAQTGQPPVIANGNAAVVNSTGNNAPQTQKLPNGQTIATSVTLQQAFNYNASDGSPSVFQVLENLYNTLNNNLSTDSSAVQVNVVGTSIVAGTNLSQLQNPGSIASTPLTLDNGAPPETSISIASAAALNGVTITFPPTDTIANVITAINAQTGLTCVSASFNYQTDRMTLTGFGAFSVTDVPTPGTGATTSGNFVSTFHLQNQADVVNNISTQLGDIDHATQVLLTARAQVGSTTQQVLSLNATATTQVTADTAVQSGIEDTNVAQATTQFSATQTALQAAYSTTSQLEQKDLFDYLS